MPRPEDYTGPGGCLSSIAGFLFVIAVIAVVIFLLANV
jgi:hypothetical protein